MFRKTGALILFEWVPLLFGPQILPLQYCRLFSSEIFNFLPDMYDPIVICKKIVSSILQITIGSVIRILAQPGSNSHKEIAVRFEKRFTLRNGSL